MAARQRVYRAGPGEEPVRLSRGNARRPNCAPPVHQGGRRRVRPRRLADARAPDPEPPALSSSVVVTSPKIDARLSPTAVRFPGGPRVRGASYERKRELSERARHAGESDAVERVRRVLRPKGLSPPHAGRGRLSPTAARHRLRRSPARDRRAGAWARRARPPRHPARASRDARPRSDRDRGALAPARRPGRSRVPPAARRGDPAHPLRVAPRPDRNPRGSDDPPQLETRRPALAPCHLSLARPRTPTRERGVHLQWARSRRLRVPPFPEARRAVRPVPR